LFATPKAKKKGMEKKKDEEVEVAGLRSGQLLERSEESGNGQGNWVVG
jgi:hypothetical protein